MSEPRKFSVDIGDGESRSFLVRHDLSERDVFVSVYDAKTGDSLVLRGMDVCGIGMNVIHTSVDEVQVFWPGWTPGPGQARVVVLG